jgi:hypothetical protein
VQWHIALQQRLQMQNTDTITVLAVSVLLHDGRLRQVALLWTCQSPRMCTLRMLMPHASLQ